MRITRSRVATIQTLTAESRHVQWQPSRGTGRQLLVFVFVGAGLVDVVEQTAEVGLGATATAHRLARQSFARRIVVRERLAVEVFVLGSNTVIAGSAPRERLHAQLLMARGGDLAVQLADLVACDQPR